MKRILSLSLVLGFMLMSSALIAQQQPQQPQGIDPSRPLAVKERSNVKDVVATVEAIDQQNRMVTLRGEMGQLRTIKVDDDVDISKVKKGDKVRTQFYERFAASIKKNEPKKAPMKETSTKVFTATSAGKPIKVETVETKQVADVLKVNQKEGTITLKGVKGSEVKIMVQNPSNLIGVQKGDQVEAVFTESVAYSVTKQ